MRKLTLAFLISAATIVSATAADQIPSEESLNWSGGYIGAQFGHAWGESNASITPCPFSPNCSLYLDPDGFFGGIYAGYNHQFSNNIVLGIDTDINLSGVDSGDVVLRATDGTPRSQVEGSAETKWDGAIRARLGYAAGRWLPYLAGGLSVARVDLEAHLVTPILIWPAGTSLASEKETLTGWNIGAGVEYAATSNITLRAEYRYTDFGTQRFPVQNDILNVDGKMDLSTHDVRIGVAYRF